MCSSVNQWDEMLNKNHIFTILQILPFSFGRTDPVGCYINEDARRAIVECQHSEKRLRGSEHA